MNHIDFEKLDILSLSILVSLYENKSATHVSKILNVPAPKISRCLKTARSIFGNELFLRKKYGLIPNEFAAKVYPIAKEIVNCAKGFNQLGNPAFAGNKNFELVTPGLISYAYPKALMQAIKQQNKQLHINLNSWGCNSLQGIIDGNISAGLCSCHYPQELQAIGSKLQIEALRKLDSLYLICNKNHPLLSRELTLETIAEYPYINTDLGLGPNSLSPFEDYCRINNLDLNVEMTITGISSLSAYLEASQAVALVPYKAVFDLLGEEPLLHLCKLSEMETTRLFNVTEPLTLTLLSPSGQQDPDLEWIRSQLRLVSGTLL